jgi:NADPH-dependent curcumin reductase
MPQTATVNRRIALAKRPVGTPQPADFRLEEGPRPTPLDGQVLLRTLYLSLDPYMRGRMSDAASYAEPVAVGETMCGGTVCRVEESRHPGFKAGERVLAYTGWQDYALSDGAGLTRLDLPAAQASRALGVLGMPGFTAYVGLLDIGQPKAGETVVVAAATGAVGSVVGQIAKLTGCRAVGVAGGRDKCDYAVRELGFDACLDHHAEGLPAALAAACPTGIDVYYENVGGPVFDAVLPLLNVGSRVPLCGLIAYYNAERLSPGPDLTPVLLRAILVKRIKLQGFIIFDHYERRYADFAATMGAWLKAGRIKVREDVVEGLERAPQAFIGLLRGDNFGKLVVRVGADG